MARLAERQRVEALDWAKVIEDVRPFVESPADLEVLTQDNVSGALEPGRPADLLR